MPTASDLSFSSKQDGTQTVYKFVLEFSSFDEYLEKYIVLLRASSGNEVNTDNLPKYCYYDSGLLKTTMKYSSGYYSDSELFGWIAPAVQNAGYDDLGSGFLNDDTSKSTVVIGTTNIYPAELGSDIFENVEYFQLPLDEIVVDTSVKKDFSLASSVDLICNAKSKAGDIRDAYDRFTYWGQKTGVDVTSKVDKKKRNVFHINLGQGTSEDILNTTNKFFGSYDSANPPQYFEDPGLQTYGDVRTVLLSKAGSGSLQNALVLEDSIDFSLIPGMPDAPVRYRTRFPFGYSLNQVMNGSGKRTLVEGKFFDPASEVKSPSLTIQVKTYAKGFSRNGYIVLAIGALAIVVLIGVAIWLLIKKVFRGKK